jgi:hypothetical protein
VAAFARKAGAAQYAIASLFRADRRSGLRQAQGLCHARGPGDVSKIVVYSICQQSPRA